MAEVEVVLTRRAAKDLTRLERSIQLRILRKLRENAHDPLVHARKLSNPKIGSFRYRIGDFRVVFDLEDERLVVLRIGDRKEIYS